MSREAKAALAERLSRLYESKGEEEQARLLCYLAGLVAGQEAAAGIRRK